MDGYLAELRKLVGSRPLFVPGVRAIVLDDAGRVLLQHRTDNNTWGLPAGSVEFEETALQAIFREVKEETNLDVIEAEPMAVYSGPTQRFVYPNGDDVRCFSVAFVIRKWTGEPKADGEEGSDVRFFATDDLPAEMVEMHRDTIEDFTKYDGTFFLGS